MTDKYLNDESKGFQFDLDIGELYLDSAKIDIAPNNYFYKNEPTSAEFAGVHAFQTAFDHPTSDTPVPLTKERNYTRSKWILEEVIESIFASSGSEEDFLDQVDALKADLDVVAFETLKKNPNVELPHSNFEKIVGQVDGLVDAMYFVLGSFVELGVNPKSVFDIVQQANMAKLGSDGNPIIRESDGKIMKPENWERDHAPEPRIREEIERQMNR